MGVRTTWRGGWGEDNLVNIQCRGHTWFGGLTPRNLPLAADTRHQVPASRQLVQRRSVAAGWERGGGVPRVVSSPVVTQL